MALKFEFGRDLNHKVKDFMARRIEICLNYDFGDYNDFYDLDFSEN